MKPRDQFGLDALLGRWPAQDPQEKGGLSWDDRADAIVKAALARKGEASSEALAALTEPPALTPEPGEEKAGDFQFHEVPAVQGARHSQPGAEKGPMSNDAPKRPSLKELAARASVAGAARASVPPSIRPSAPPSAPATVTPIAKARAARASDPGREDSGVLRLADLQAKEAEKAEAAAAAAEASLAAAAAKRAEGQAAAAAAPIVAKPAANENKGSSTGMWAGVGIAVLGVAAAFAIYKSRAPEAPPAPVAATTEAKPQPAPVATVAPKPQPTAEPAAVASAETDPTSAPTATPAADDPKAGTAGGSPASTAVVVASNDTKSASPQASAKAGSQVGTLDEEMKKAVGSNGELPSAPQDESKPAAASGNVPEQPSQGNAQAAIRAVMPGAKACVAGAPEPTSASVTFGSSGGVQSVSVGGWAAANGKAGCVKSALQGARVAPFAKPTFTVPVTVRP